MAVARVWYESAGMGGVPPHLALYQRGRTHAPCIWRGVRRFVVCVCSADAASRVFPALGAAVASHVGVAASGRCPHQRPTVAGQPWAKCTYRQAPAAGGFGSRRSSGTACVARDAAVVAGGYRQSHRGRKRPQPAGTERAGRFGRPLPYCCAHPSGSRPCGLGRRV